MNENENTAIKNEGVDMFDLIQIFWKHKLIIAAFMIVCAFVMLLKTAYFTNTPFCDFFHFFHFGNSPNTPLKFLDYLRSIFCSRVTLSQDWLPTVQLVLQADWQVLLHSPQPVTFLSWGFAIVLIISLSPDFDLL